MATRDFAAGAWLALFGTAACGSDPIAGGTEEEGTSSLCRRRPAETQVYSGETHLLTPISVPCRAEGERTIVYVADELWGSVVTRGELAGFLQSFEATGSSASLHPDLGILPTNELVFAPLDPSELPSHKVEIFVVGTEGAGEGYLCGWCDHPQLHLDAELVGPLDGELALSIAAHESVHLLHRAKDPNELVWIDESLAEAAMTVNGFFTDQEWLAAFLSQPNRDWGPGHDDVTRFHYGAGLLFGTYLFEQGGPALLSALTNEPENGWAGVDAALSAVGDPRSGFELFLDMALAVYLDDPEAGFGFASFDFEPVLTRGELEPGSTSRVALAPYGLAFHPLASELTTLRLVEAEAGVVARAVNRDSLEVELLEVDRDLALASGTWFVAATSDRSATYELAGD